MAKVNMLDNIADVLEVEISQRDVESMTPEELKQRIYN